MAMSDNLPQGGADAGANADSAAEEAPQIKNRFRGFLPVVVDLETSGFHPEQCAILEVAMIPLRLSPQGALHPHETYCSRVLPFPGAKLDPACLEFTGISDPHDPGRRAYSEPHALANLLRNIRRQVSEQGCTRAVLVGHNANFDHSFLMAAAKRCSIKRNPFHPFSVFDTVSLAAMAFGQTVLAKACMAAQIDFDKDAAHSAQYDAMKTAELFCAIINRWQKYAQPAGQRAPGQ